MHYQYVPEGRDLQLWQLAQRRAAFRPHLTTYLVMSVFFWALWYITGGGSYNRSLPWPVWPMLGWGIGVLAHYNGAYRAPRATAAEHEYEKLITRTNQ